MEVEIRRVSGAATLEDAFAVRRTVFIEEQGVSEAVEMDGHDDDASHVVAYERSDDGVAERPVGTARLRERDPETAKVERVAVLRAHRGEGVGRQLMTAIEDLAAAEGYETLVLHAQTAVEGFYDALDYETTSDVFEEAGIPHVEMEKPV